MSTSRSFDDYPRPTLAVDVALLSVQDDGLHTVLVQRLEPPFAGDWQLPGVLVAIDEELEEAAQRALSTKAGLDAAYVEQLYTFGALDRDPRGRVISVAYFALLGDSWTPRRDGVLAPRIEVGFSGERPAPVTCLAADGSPLRLSFDHALILGTAIGRLRGKLGYVPVGFELLPERFPLRALQRVHETILGRPLNKDSFRKSMLERGWVEPTGEREPGAAHRPAELYRASGSPAGTGVSSTRSMRAPSTDSTRSS
jgi:8-oxo-dGTP diphosphatase